MDLITVIEDLQALLVLVIFLMIIAVGSRFGLGTTQFLTNETFKHCNYFTEYKARLLSDKGRNPARD